MKFFSKLALKEGFKKLLKGSGRVLDNTLLGGVVTNVTKEIEGSPKGKLDVNRLIRVIVSSTIPVILLIALLKGWISIEDLKQLLKLF